MRGLSLRGWRLALSAAAGCVLVSVPLAASATATFTVNTTADTVDSSPGDGACADSLGACSLRAAVMEANALSGPDTIVVPSGTYDLTRAGSGEDGGETGDLDVISTIIISGAGATVDAGRLDRAFDVLGSGSLEVTGLAVRNGVAPGAESGGAYRSSGTLRLQDARVDTSVALGPGGSGGAILNDGGELVVRSSHLDRNQASRAGGAIEADGGITTVISSTITGNRTGPAPGNGGGLHLTGPGTVTVTGTVLTDNVAAREGGGLWNSATGTMTVTDSTLVGNAAEGPAAHDGGGAIFNDGGDLVVQGSNLLANSAPGSAGSGGGLFNNRGSVLVRASTIAANDAVRAGGGVEALEGSTTLSQVRLLANSTGASPGNGGGLHLTGAGVVAVDQSLVVLNRAANEGGGLWNSATGSMTVTSSLVVANVAPVSPDFHQD